MDIKDRKMIMVVEDDTNLSKFMSDRLRLEGFGVIPYYTVEDALRSLKKWRPDLIILDILMPGMNGVTFLQNVEASTQSHIPIVVHSAVADPDEMIKYDNVDAVVPKGAEPATLVGIVKQLLGMGYHMEPNTER
jgi:DNA-binding response OmpR family regulator